MTASQQVRRPLVGIACSLVAGLCTQHFLGGSPFLFLGLAAGAMAWVCWSPKHRRATPAFYLSVALVAAAAGSVEKMETPSCGVLPVAEVLFREQEIIGRIDEPSSVADEDESQSFRFRAEAVRVGSDWFRSDALLRVYIKSLSETPEYGERWRVKGRYRSYEKRRTGMEGSLRATDAFWLHKAPFSFKGTCYRARQRAARFLCEGIDAFPEQVSLLHALLLGYRKALAPELYQLFATTGTLHIFAISGLHVGVLAAILIAALKIIGVPRPVWGILLIPGLYIYVVSTGMKPSAFRAFTMASVYFAAPLCRRRPDVVSSIALAAILLLVINPLQLVEPGFLLSFAVVSGIVMVHGYTNRRLTGFSRPSWAIPLAQLSGPRPLVALVRAIGLLTLTSIAAWLFSAPLTARFFNTLSPVALVGNLAIIPLTFMIVLTGCLALLSVPLSLVLTAVFNHANQIFVSLLISIIGWFGSLPGAYGFVRSPAPAVLVFWYTGWILFFTGTARLRKLAFVFLTGSVLLWGGGLFRLRSGVEIHRVGSSATAIRITPSDWVLVTDGNAYSTGRTTRRLQKEGVNRLHALVVSDRRAKAEAVKKLWSVFAPEQVWMAPGLRNGRTAEALRAAGVPFAFSSRPGWKVGEGELTVPLGGEESY